MSIKSGMAAFPSISSYSAVVMIVSNWCLLNSGNGDNNTDVDQVQASLIDNLSEVIEFKHFMKHSVTP